MNIKKTAVLALATALTTFTSPVGATSAWVSDATIRQTMVDSVYFGGCMILIDKSISDSGLNCPGGWVSFSCSGDFNTKDFAYRKLDSAQMAMALGKRVNLYVDDTKKHNNYCFARRIDVLN